MVEARSKRKIATKREWRMKLAAARATTMERSRKGQVVEKGRGERERKRVGKPSDFYQRRFKSNQLEKFDFPSFRGSAFHEVAAAFPLV